MKDRTRGAKISVRRWDMNTMEETFPTLISLSLCLGGNLQEGHLSLVVYSVLGSLLSLANVRVYKM